MQAVRAYALPAPLFWTFRDAADDERLSRLRFHIEKGDYFPFLATVIGILKEAAERCGGTDEARYAEDVRKDLIHLHERYRLAPKEEALSYSRRKVVRFDA